MSYEATLRGHARTEEAERKLHARLAEVSQEDPDYGLTYSHFGGQHVHGTIHEHHSPQTEHTHHSEP